MDESLHLLFPLFSSLVFVAGAMLARRATLRGTSPYTTTFLANILLAGCWVAVGCAQGELLAVSGWWPAFWIAVMFVGGQLCTYLAFQWGDVSLATPIFGVKIIEVALISAWVSQQPVPTRIGIAAGLAALGIAVIQAGAGQGSRGTVNARKAAVTIVLALLAATALSLFDVGLQRYGREYGPVTFLSGMFGLTGVLSCGLLPWVDRPSQIRERNAMKPLLLGGILMAVQAISISYSLGRFGDATRINIVYSLRGLWSVVVAWLFSHFAVTAEAKLSRRTIVLRLLGALLLLISILMTLS